MPPVPEPRRGEVAYVLKRYPRLSETFILNELIAHQEAGLPLSLFSLGPPEDGVFHELVGRLRAPVFYLGAQRMREEACWKALEGAFALPGFELPGLALARGEPGRRVFQALRLATLAHERGVRHLHAHFATGPASVARLASAWSGIPWSFTAHAKDIYHESVDPGDLAEKLGSAAVTFTVSDFNRRHLQRRHGDRARRVVRLYNGLDLRRLAFRDDARPPRILGVGRLVAKKGFDHLVEAAARLASRGRAFTCDLIGEGPQRAELEARIRKHGLEDRVRLRGALPHATVLEELGRAAVLAAPCCVGPDGDRDGLPTVLLEAMALGTPCVAHAVTGIPELIEDGVTGLLAAEGDPEALADALEALLLDAGRARELAVAARRQVEERFDSAATTAAMRRVLLEGGPAEETA